MTKAGRSSWAHALLVLLAMTFPTSGLEAQGHPQTREGFWISGDLGYGSLGIEDFSDHEEGLSGNLTLGGTLSPHWLLGGGTTGWTKEVAGVRVTFGTVALMARYYPNVSGGFFLNGDLGVGRVSLSSGNVTVSESGGGAILGLGYDVRLGPDWSFTPFANAVGFSIEGGQADVFQFGLGMTRHWGAVPLLS